MRLGFLGTGWIGRDRMGAILQTGQANAAALCDPNPEMLEQARAIAPEAVVVGDLDQMLALDLDGIVIATPSALHAQQCIASLQAGAAVFCQKPLGRNAGEVKAILEAARHADRLLGVDLSYRHTAAAQAIRDRARNGELGHVFAADMVFHNAYGPGAGWFWDKELSGGGCLIDLGVHLVDMVLWLFDWPDVAEARATLRRGGRPLGAGEVEDYAAGTFELANGLTVRLACSWNLHAGTDAVIETTFYGTNGAVSLHNLNGSFFDFAAEVRNGRQSQVLASPPDDWSGRAAAEWVRKLSAAERFAGSTGGLLETAQALDRLYASA